MIIEYEKEDSDDSKNESGLDVIDSAQEDSSRSRETHEELIDIDEK